MFAIKFTDEMKYCRPDPNKIKAGLAQIKLHIENSSFWKHSHLFNKNALYYNLYF